MAGFVWSSYEARHGKETIRLVKNYLIKLIIKFGFEFVQYMWNIDVIINNIVVRDSVIS